MRRRQNKRGWVKTKRKNSNKIFVISEGKITEPSYIDQLNQIRRDREIKVVMSGSKNVAKIKREVQKIKRTEGQSSEIWIALDMNSRTELQLSELYKIELEYNKVKVALSNPFFEIWLLYHYDDAKDVHESSNPEAAKAQCIRRLKNIEGWENYEKEVGEGLITEQNIAAAIKRAKKHDTPRSKKWPRKLGATTFYRLVESYLNRK